MTAIITEAVVGSITGDLSGALGMIAVASLVVLLVAKELAGASEGRRFKAFNEHSVVGIVPLLIAFGLIVIVKTLEVLA